MKSIHLILSIFFFGFAAPLWAQQDSVPPAKKVSPRLVAMCDKFPAFSLSNDSLTISVSFLLNEKCYKGVMSLNENGLFELGAFPKDSTATCYKEFSDYYFNLKSQDKEQPEAEVYNMLYFASIDIGLAKSHPGEKFSGKF